MPDALADSPPLDSNASVDKSSERVQRMFGEIAPRYDLLNHLLSMQVDRYWRWRTTRLVPPTTTGKLSGNPILDLCTGTGDLALAYDRAAKGATSIVGADFCPPMLERAREKCAKISADDRIDWIEADAERLPFENDAFQIVSVAFGLRNVADTDQGLREMTRVCHPGGKVAILEFTTPRRQPLRSLYGWYFRNVLPKIGQAVMRNHSAAYEYLPESVGQFLEYEQLTRRMEQAGLQHIRFHPMTFGIATLYIGEKKRGNNIDG